MYLVVVLSVVVVKEYTVVVVASEYGRERKKEEERGRTQDRRSADERQGWLKDVTSDQITAINVPHRYIKHRPHCFPRTAHTPSSHRTAVPGSRPRTSRTSIWVVYTSRLTCKNLDSTTIHKYSIYKPNTSRYIPLNIKPSTEELRIPKFHPVTQRANPNTYQHDITPV